MYYGEIFRENLNGNRLAILGLDLRCIAVADAVIRFGDTLLINNLSDSEFSRERNSMYLAHRVNPNAEKKWETNALLRIVCPDSDILVTSSRILESQNDIDKQTQKSQSTRVKQQIGSHVVKFQTSVEGHIDDIVHAERVLNVSYSPKSETITVDDFKVTVFRGAQINFTGEVSGGLADDVFDMLRNRFNTLLHTS